MNRQVFRRSGSFACGLFILLAGASWAENYRATVIRGNLATNYMSSVAGGKFYFYTEVPGAAQLWVTEGTSATTRHVAMLPTTSGLYLKPFINEMQFGSMTAQISAVTDGNSTQTMLARGFPNGAVFYEGVPFAGKTAFRYSNFINHETSPTLTDGTVAGTYYWNTHSMFNENIGGTANYVLGERLIVSGTEPNGSPGTHLFSVTAPPSTPLKLTNVTGVTVRYRCTQGGRMYFIVYAADNSHLVSTNGQDFEEHAVFTGQNVEAMTATSQHVWITVHVSTEPPQSALYRYSRSNNKLSLIDMGQTVQAQANVYGDHIYVSIWTPNKLYTLNDSTTQTTPLGRWGSLQGMVNNRLIVADSPIANEFGLSSTQTTSQSRQLLYSGEDGLDSNASMVTWRDHIVLPVNHRIRLSDGTNAGTMLPDGLPARVDAYQISVLNDSTLIAMVYPEGSPRATMYAIKPANGTGAAWAGYTEGAD